MMMLHFIRNQWISITAALLVSITFLSLWPANSLPEIPGRDKLHHFLAYAVLMFPTVLRRPKHYMLIGMFFATWGGAIELIQPYVNRYGEWLDFTANIAGLLITLPIGAVARNYGNIQAITHNQSGMIHDE